MASRGLQTTSDTSTKQNYCLLETETLAIVFAYLKFNEYLYGKTFIIESDHKPLRSTLNTPIHSATSTIQLFIMFLQKHDFVVKYVHGRDFICCDTSSRAPIEEQTPEISETEIICQVHSVISSFSINTERLKPKL